MRWGSWKSDAICKNVREWMRANIEIYETDAICIIMHWWKRANIERFMKAMQRLVDRITKHEVSRTIYLQKFKIKMIKRSKLRIWWRIRLALGCLRWRGREIERESDDLHYPWRGEWSNIRLFDAYSCDVIHRFVRLSSWIARWKRLRCNMLLTFVHLSSTIAYSEHG